MKIHQVVQGTPAWLRLRAGIPTSSEFSSILTPSGKLSTSCSGYMYVLLAEWILGRPLEQYESQFMIRGQQLEDDAVAAYEFDAEVETQPVGFVTNDDGTIGASPDRLVGDDGLLEIKCPLAQTHVGYMLTGSIEDKFRPQLQGQLYVTERKWVDIFSYHPELAPKVIRVHRDEKYIETLADALTEFVKLMLQKRVELEQKYGPFIRKPLGDDEPEGDFDVTDEDLDRILAARRDAVL